MIQSIRQFVLFACVLVVTGCGASASLHADSKTPASASATAQADGFKKAINPETGACERGRSSATDADYTSCLERRMQAMSSVPSSAPQAPPAAPTPPAASATAAPPQAGGMLVPPNAGTTYVPAIGGATCDANKSLEAMTLEVFNPTPYAVEIQAPYAAPLNCDVTMNFVRMVVIRQGESTPREVLAIKPGSTARYVFLPMNGGMGKHVLYWVRAYLPLSVMGGMAVMPSPEVSLHDNPATFSGEFPRAGGNNTRLYPQLFSASN